MKWFLDFMFGYPVGAYLWEKSRTRTEGRISTDN